MKSLHVKKGDRVKVIAGKDKGLVGEIIAVYPERQKVTVVLEDDGRVLVELDVGTVDTTTLLGRADDDGLDHVALLHVATGDRVLDGGDDEVADAGIPTTRTAEHADAKDLLGTGVVGDAQSRLLLDHFSLLSSCWFSCPSLLGWSLAELDFRSV